MLSVVIPVYNSNTQLELTLGGFAEQSIKQNSFEIIVVDDGSSVKAKEIVDKFTDEIKNLHYVYQENGGRAKARNGARNMINGEIVVFNDADRIPSPLFLENHEKIHQENNSCIGIGEVKEVYFTDILAKKDKIFEIVRTDSRMAKKIPVHKALYSIYDDTGSTGSSVPWLTTFSGNMSIPKQLLDKIGWFDEEFIDWGFEHFELGYRLFKAGAEFKYNKLAINYHLAHSRPKGSLINSMRNSHQYFVRKHPNPEIKELMKFMMGEISLQEFEGIARKEKTINPIKPMYLKIIN